MSSVAGVPEPALFDVKLPPAPYPGLRPFDRHEWPIFFGREPMTRDVITCLLDHSLVVVHGDSGCGKSSLIRAGVLVQLEQQLREAEQQEAAAQDGRLLKEEVDAEDIADVAFAALTQDGHAGELYELTGPRALRIEEAVAEIAAASGKALTFTRITPEA